MDFKIKCHVYPFTVHVFIEDNVKEALQKYETYYKCPIANEGDFDALTVFPENIKSKREFDRVSIILGKSNGTLLSRIHHELIHVSTYILHKVGVEVSHQNDEALAYLSSFLFERIIKKLNLI